MFRKLLINFSLSDLKLYQLGLVVFDSTNFGHLLSSWCGIEHYFPGHSCATQLSEVHVFLNWLRPWEFHGGSGITGQKAVVLLGTG